MNSGRLIYTSGNSRKAVLVSSSIGIVAFLLVVSVASDASAQVSQVGGSIRASVVIGQANFTATSSSVGRSSLSGPLSICFDPSSNLWASDVGNNRILEFKPPFTNGMGASVVIGHAGFTTSTALTNPSTLSQPAFIACDSQGDIWIADGGNNRVLEFKPPFTNGMNASLVIGQPNFSVSRAATTANGLHTPEDIAFDLSGNLWVSDLNNNRILEFKPPFTNGMNASVVIGQVIFTANDSAAGQNRLHGPSGIMFDSEGNLWVSDYGNSRVLEFKPPFTNGMNASVVIGHANYLSEIPQGEPSASGISGPNGLAFDSSGNLWVSDINYNRVLEFGEPFFTGMSAMLVVGQPNFTARSPELDGHGGLYGPTDMAFDSNENLWVADYHNNRILEFRYSSFTEVASSSSAKTGGPFSSTAYFTATVVAVIVSASTWLALRNRHRHRKVS